MPEQSIELHAIMARLERVEKENRRLKLAGIMFLLVTCAVVVTGQSQTNRTLEAERFVLKDQSGKIRAELSTENGLQSSLKFYDETGKKRTYYADHALLVQAGHDTAIFSAGGFDILGEHTDVRVDRGKLYISGELGSLSIGTVPAFREGTHGVGLILNGGIGRLLSINIADGPVMNNR